MKIYSPPPFMGGGPNYEGSISNSFCDIMIKSLDHNPSLSSSWQPSWKSWQCIFVHILSFIHWIFMKIGIVINFAVTNPKIILRSFSKQKNMLKFWKNVFWNSIHLPTAQIISISHSCPSLTKPILC